MGCLLRSFGPSACDKHLHWRRMGVLFRTGKDAVCYSLLVLQPVINTYTGGEYGLFATLFRSLSL